MQVLTAQQYSGNPAVTLNGAVATKGNAFFEFCKGDGHPGWPHPLPFSSSQATSWTTVWPSGTCQSGDTHFF